jgi:hypothetical protein
VVPKETEIHPLEMKRDSQGRKRFVSAKAVAQPFQAGLKILPRLESLGQQILSKSTTS